MGTLSQLQRVLIVEDNDALLSAIARHVTGWGVDALQARTCAEAKEMLVRLPDLLISDIRLPDGSGFEVLEEASKTRPKPLLVAMSGEASTEEAFRLGQIGVRAYLQKPLSLEDLTEAVKLALAQAPDFEGLISDCVGHVPMRELQGQLRTVMLDQALALAGGNRSIAARLLDVSRQAVQQILRSDRKPRDSKAEAQENLRVPPPSSAD
jgi:DNA-binding NtrC family response regulator